MFFEVGNVAGGLVFGLVAQLCGKRASFGSARRAVRRRPVVAAHPRRAGVRTRAPDVPGARRRRLSRRYQDFVPPPARPDERRRLDEPDD